MTILFDLTYIKDSTYYSGVAKYAYRFLDFINESEYNNEFVLLCNIRALNIIKKKYSNYKIVCIGHKTISHIPFIRNIDVAVELKRYVDSSKCNLLFVPHGGETNCLKVKLPKITVIHDLQLQIDTKGFRRFLYKKRDDMVVKNSDIILTISDFSRNQILTAYPGISQKLKMMGNSISEISETTISNSSLFLPQNYILYVGRLSRQKNTITLIKAFCRTRVKFSDLFLVLVTTDWNYWDNEIVKMIKDPDVLSHVIILKNISDEDLHIVYKKALLFVFPSLREGWGSPPIEAACMGIPVVTTLVDSLREVTMDMLYSYNNPMDEIELSQKIEEVLSNPPSKIVLDRIKATYVHSYSYRVFGKRLYDFLKQCVVVR